MKKLPVALWCGIAVVAVTVVLYFTILNNTLLEAIHFIAFTCVVLSEIITTAYACAAKGNPRKEAAVVIVGMMIPVSIILSIVYILCFPKGYGTYIGAYVAGLVVVNVVALVLLRFDRKRQEENVRLQNAKGNILILRKMVQCIMLEEAAQPYAQRLQALDENLHFTNDGVIYTEDERLYKMLLLLQQNIAVPDFEIEKHLTEIEKTVQKRTIMNVHNV